MSAPGSLNPFRRKRLRRYTDKLRLLADQAWKRGSKELSDDLHEVARKEEARRRA